MLFDSEINAAACCTNGIAGGHDSHVPKPSRKKINRQLTDELCVTSAGALLRTSQEELTMLPRTP